MPESFNFTTDDPLVAQRILSVIRGEVIPDKTPAEKPAKTAKSTAPAAATAAPAASPFPPQPAAPTAAFPSPAPAAETPSAPAATPPASAPPATPTAGTTNGAAPPAHLSQAIEATNAQMDIFLKTHKAGEAKAVLQKYNIRRVSDATDVNMLHAIYTEFGGQ